jgi:murein L,D-transpeptidase YcbB/YkuD
VLNIKPLSSLVPLRMLLALPLLLLVSCGNSTAEVTAADLQAAATEGPAQNFYERNGWQPVWSDEAAEELEEALETRALHGLDRTEFLRPEQDSPAAREAALTEAALAYATALARGLSNPEEHYDIYTIPRPEADLVAGLSQALASGQVGQWLASLPPQDSEYQAISRAYQRWRGAAGQQPAISLAGGSLIRRSDRDPRVPEIARALELHGYLPAGGGEEAGQTATLYSGRIAQAVERFQQDRGMAVDGVVGPDTIRALNRDAGDLARAAAVALERRRWLSRTPAADRIDVNTAAATLEYYRGGELADRRRVIVGQPDWQTPQLQSSFYRLVANPTWTVPKSIEEAELADVGPGELRRRNMVRRDGWIVQLSGPDNALGLVKFDLDNDYAIYLHDTPSKSLFSQDVRQLSHGCVRVEDALGFASMIAGQQGISEEWQEARLTGEETFVRLTNPIPVRLLYHPTYLAPSGEVRFEQDIYGRNDPIARQLGFDRGARRRFVPEIEDFGP